MNNIIYLSPSKLNLFQDCPLCFWLHMVRGIRRPESIFPSLPSGMDGLIKKYFDKYRALGKLPPALEGKVQGNLLPDQEILEEWRSISKKSSPKYFDNSLNAQLFGALDECFIDGEFYIPVDYKTRGYDLKEDSLSYYQTQMDCYTFLLEAEGYKHLSFAYLIYYIVDKVEENGSVKFRVEPYKLETNPKRGCEVFRQAVKLLQGPKPSPNNECNFCSWANDWLKS